MGVSKTVTITCDYAGCTENAGRPGVVSWCETDVEHGRAELPELARYVVIINWQQKILSFCCQLHAAAFWLPPGQEIKQKKIVELPNKNPSPDPKMIEQGDGVREDDDPVNGQCECGHLVEHHNKYGCQIILSKEPGDFCKCTKRYLREES